MSYQLRFEDAVDSARITFPGSFGLDQLETAVLEVLEHPTFQTSHSLIVNLAPLSDSSIKSISRLAERIARHPRRPRGGVALLVPEQTHRLGGQAFAMYLSYLGIDARVFPDEIAARSWLLDRSARAS